MRAVFITVGTRRAAQAFTAHAGPRQQLDARLGGQHACRVRWLDDLVMGVIVDAYTRSFSDAEASHTTTNRHSLMSA